MASAIIVESATYFQLGMEVLAPVSWEEGWGEGGKEGGMFVSKRQNIYLEIARFEKNLVLILVSVLLEV